MMTATNINRPSSLESEPGFLNFNGICSGSCMKKVPDDAGQARKRGRVRRIRKSKRR